MIYRTAQEAVLDALRAGRIPPELAKLVDPATGLVGGEISPGAMREFDPFTGQVHYQYALPVDMSGINPGLKTVNPEAGPVPPNMMPVGSQQRAAFSSDENDWAASRQPGQAGLTWGTQPMGGQVMAQARGGGPLGGYTNPVQMDPMLQLRNGPPGVTLPTTRPGSGAPGGMPAGLTQNPAAPFGPGGVNPATLTPGYNAYQPPPVAAPVAPVPQAGPTAEQLALISNFMQGMSGGGGVASSPSVGQALAGRPFESQIPNLFGRPNPNRTGPR